MSVLVKDGRIITAVDDYAADILIEGETVAAIGAVARCHGRSSHRRRRQICDPGRDRPPHAHGDALRRHRHMRRLHLGHVIGGIRRHHLADRLLPAGARASRFPDALATWHEKIERCPPVIDVGFHIAITDLHDGGELEDVAKVPDQGVTSYKLFMAYKGAIMVDDETLFRIMQVAAETGRAGDGPRRERRRDRRARQAGAGRGQDRAEAGMPRPGRPITEGEATSRAIQLAHLADCPLYVVHVSCEESIEPVAAARAAGWRIWGETCTQYLFIEQTRLEEPDFAGRQVRVHAAAAPAAQPGAAVARAPNRTPLGGVDRPLPVPVARSEDARRRDDFSKIPNGGPGSRTGCTCSTTSACARAG